MRKRKFYSMFLLALVSLLCLACAVFFTACGNNEMPDDEHNTEQGGENPDDDEPGTDPDDESIAVTSVALDKTSLTLEIGESYTLVVTVSPSNATDKSITWSSTNSSIASVSGGKVTAKSDGTTTITAEAHNGKTATCTVTVNESEPDVIEVTSVSLNKTSLTLEIGESETLTATVLPSNATDKSVTWTSSAQSIATVANGKITAIGSGTATITATTSNGKTATCMVTVNAAVPEITQVEGATIDGTDIFMLVDYTTDSVALLNKVTVSSGSWDLYADILGQNRIPTKIAAGSNGRLQNGNNVFYIMLENENGDLEEVYTLTVYRSYAVTVDYYNHKDVLVHSDTAYTGYEYALNYDYTTPGYTFNDWTENGTAYQAHVLWDKLSLYADMTANSYTVSLDANGGEVAEETQTVTYDDSYVFPVPVRTGYTFLGWYSGDVLLADTEDETSSLWKYTDITSATAKWQINQYTLTTEGLSAAGTFTEGGTYDYGTSLTLTASSPNLGYDFLGWYEGDTCLTTENVYTFAVPDKDIVLTAKYEVKAEMAPFYFNSTQTECTITGIRNTSVKEITVPNYVTEIKNSAFSKCSSLNSITIPFAGISFFGSVFGAEKASEVSEFIPASLKSVTITNGYIGDYSFYNCSNLTSITIFDGVTSIGSSAFYGCSGLKEVHIADLAAWCTIEFSDFSSNPLYYAHNLYLNDSLITDLIIPDSVTSIGGSAFSGCSGLTSVTIPDSVTSIGSSAFSGCSGLTIVTIPDSVTSIGGSAFRDCSSLTSVAIPDSVTSIGSSAFSGCSGLTSVTIPDSVTSIDGGAFSGCSGLTSVTIGNSVTSIGNYAFSGCSGLTSITIPDSVTSIENFAFDGCSGLTCVTIPESVKVIGKHAFYGCTSLTKIFYNAVSVKDLLDYNGKDQYGHIKYIYYEAFYNAGNNGSGITVVFGDNVQTIPACLFYVSDSRYRPNITSVTIGDSVTSIGDSAFSGCSRLTKVHITDLAAWCTIEFSNSSSNPFCYADNLYLNDSLITDLIIPDSVTSIGDSAFSGCSGLTSVTIGNSVTSIGNSAFYNCSGLTSITIPDSVTSVRNYAFENCSSLTSVTIGNSVTLIGDSAFYNCSSLTSVTFENPKGWWVTSSTSIASSDLSNPSTAATYLRSTYRDYYWKRG